MIVDGESEESAWEETESESEREGGEGRDSDSYTVVTGSVTVPK
ncbi:hypothetical protein KIPB_012746, partial [Kipferlia bialata]|eukprot:g12746.t1